MIAKSIIFNEIKDYFKLDGEGRLWNLLIGSGRRGKKGEWKPCYQNNPDKRGYLVTRLKGASYKQHRIIFCLATKQDVPHSLYIDHKNGVRHDNSIDNLRLVSHRKNLQNQSKHRNGRVVGAIYHKQIKKWIAYINLSNGVRVGLGVFETEKEAHNRYMEALELVHLSKEEVQKHFGVAQFTSKYKGVGWHKAKGKWVAQIQVSGKKKHLGLFNSEEEAYQAYLNFKKGENHEKIHAKTNKQNIGSQR